MRKNYPINFYGICCLGVISVNAHTGILTFLFCQSSDILYYEVLDIPLPELQGLKTLKVAFHRFNKDEV